MTVTVWNLAISGGGVLESAGVAALPRAIVILLALTFVASARARFSRRIPLLTAGIIGPMEDKACCSTATPNTVRFG